jgi:hypothetical protein
MSEKPWTEYKQITSGFITGNNYKVDKCNCGLPPWELCCPSCEFALSPTEPEYEPTELDLFAVEHLRSI